MLALKKIRSLDIAPTAPQRPAYVYAASGLVNLKDKLYIVADDELHLAVFDKTGETKGQWYRLLPGSLPLDYDERKQAKPDLETITYLKPYDYAPNGALLMVPSMSKKKRINGIVLPVSENFEPQLQPLPVDFTDLRKKLTDLVDELNIESIVVKKHRVRLFHRGSKGKSKSAVITLDADRFRRELHDTHAVTGEHILDCTEYDLGSIDDIPLQFTDAIALPDDRILFLATSENTSNANDDGASLGSAVGILDKAGKIERITRFNSKEKLEGVAAEMKTGSIELLLVSDTDDQSKPAALFSARLDN